MMEKAILTRGSPFPDSLIEQVNGAGCMFACLFERFSRELQRIPALKASAESAVGQVNGTLKDYGISRDESSLAQK